MERKEGLDGLLDLLRAVRHVEHAVQDGKIGGAEGEAGFHYHDIYSCYGVYWKESLS